VAIQKNLSAGDKLVQEIEIADITRQHGTAELTSLQVDEGVVQEFSLMALIFRQSTQPQRQSRKDARCSPGVILRCV